jgi:hypothetical protein
LAGFEIVDPVPTKKLEFPSKGVAVCDKPASD